MRARYGDDVRQHAVDFYRRHGSFSAAAAELGVSASWVYGVVRDSGIDRAELPVWPASLARRAAELYVEERLSCRAVAARLAAERGGAGPSHEWVAEQLRQRGLLRGKSAGQRARAEAVSRRDYADLERKARALFARGESARAVADRLGIARRTVVRWVGRTRDPATATRVRAWEAPRDDVRERLARQVRVITMRRAGATYSQIEAETGLSRSQIYLYLRAAKLVAPQPWRRRRRVLPGGPPSVD